MIRLIGMIIMAAAATLFVVPVAAGDDPVIQYNGPPYILNYQKAAAQWTENGLGKYVGPGSLLTAVKAFDVLAADLAKFKFGKEEQVRRLAIKTWTDGGYGELGPGESIQVTDLRQWRYSSDSIDDLDSYAWCVSWIQCDGRTLYPRLKNRMWIDAASGETEIMRQVTYPCEVPSASNPDGNLLSVLADPVPNREKIIGRLQASRVPYPAEVIAWEKEQRHLPIPDRVNCPFVYTLLSLAEDDDNFGKDGDLVWVVHNGPGSYEFRGETWINSRTGERFVFSVQDWE